MLHSSLQIPKTHKQVALWVYPEGRVVGSLFVSHCRRQSGGEEEPFDILNCPEPFVVVRCHMPDEIRFYNKASIVRIEYADEETDTGEKLVSLPCHLHLMDGSFIAASLRRHRPPAYSRLYDDLSLAHERFVKVYLEDGTVCLVNKSYIVTGLDPAA